MRIDRWTEIFNIEARNFLTNFRTGAVDEVEDSIIKEINRLKNKGSFTSLECGLKESLIEEMIERGYITYYSDNEETDEVRWAFERYKDKAKRDKKTVSILLDPIVGSKWCSSGESTKGISMDRVETENILRAISKRKLTNEIDLWLIIKERKSEWRRLEEVIDKNNLRIKNLYTFAKNETELTEIKDWLRISISFPITINVKYKPESFGYISLFKRDEGTISERKRTTFLEKHPFFCPFIYSTFFVDKEGNISYCVRKLINGEKIGKIDILKGEVNLENGWSNELFVPLCENSKDCIYTIYCQKMCPFLSGLHNDRKDGDDCTIASTIKKVLEEKIRSMM